MGRVGILLSAAASELLLLLMMLMLLLVFLLLLLLGGGGQWAGRGGTQHTRDGCVGCDRSRDGDGGHTIARGCGATGGSFLFRIRHGRGKE